MLPRIELFISLLLPGSSETKADKKTLNYFPMYAHIVQLDMHNKVKLIRESVNVRFLYRQLKRIQIECQKQRVVIPFFLMQIWRQSGEENLRKLFAKIIKFTEYGY